MKKEELKVVDRLGFVNYTSVKHNPQQGFSIVEYDGVVIASRDFQKLSEPHSDNDREWEEYEERLEEWKADAIIDLMPECVAYFNQNLTRVRR